MMLSKTRYKDSHTEEDTICFLKAAVYHLEIDVAMYGSLSNSAHNAQNECKTKTLTIDATHHTINLKIIPLFGPFLSRSTFF